MRVFGVWKVLWIRKYHRHENELSQVEFIILINKNSLLKWDESIFHRIYSDRNGTIHSSQHNCMCSSTQKKFHLQFKIRSYAIVSAAYNFHFHPPPCCTVLENKENYTKFSQLFSTRLLSLRMHEKFDSNIISVTLEVWNL